MATRVERLILVYNADAGLRAAVADSARKLFRRPGCSLCQITHGLVSERPEWQSCRAQLDLPIDYYHRDDMPAEVAAVANNELPCVMARTAESYLRLLGPTEVAGCTGSAQCLMARLAESARRAGLDLE